MTTQPLNNIFFTMLSDVTICDIEQNGMVVVKDE